MRTPRIVLGVLLISLAAAASPAAADDVSGVDLMLCAVVEIHMCTPVSDCRSGPPWMLNVPDFIEVDLAGKELRTTKASQENRKTPIRSLIKEDGQVVVGALENGRAFTLVVDEKTGYATMTVATFGRGGTAFGTCTPKAR